MSSKCTRKHFYDTKGQKALLSHNYIHWITLTLKIKRIQTPSSWRVCAKFDQNAPIMVWSTTMFTCSFPYLSIMTLTFGHGINRIDPLVMNYGTCTPHLIIMHSATDIYHHVQRIISIFIHCSNNLFQNDKNSNRISWKLAKARGTTPQNCGPPHGKKLDLKY